MARNYGAPSRVASLLGSLLCLICSALSVLSVSCSYPVFFRVFLWYAQLCIEKGNSQADLYQVFLSLAKGATLVFLISPHPILTSRLPPIGRQIRRDEGKVPARYCLVRA